jgi:hypothetical protein
MGPETKFFPSLGPLTGPQAKKFENYWFKWYPLLGIDAVITKNFCKLGFRLKGVICSYLSVISLKAVNSSFN